LTTLDTKQHILDEAGFVYSINRAVYFNRKSKKIISVEFAMDHDEGQTRDRG
jgi:regulator of PEP synthase PpsR (kinase-PPPase family)